MTVTIEGTDKEIAALVLAVQERRNTDMDAIYEYVIQRFAKYSESLFPEESDGTK